MTNSIQSDIREQNYALIAKGVQRFPNPRSAQEPLTQNVKPFVFILDFPAQTEELAANLETQFPETSPLFLVRRLAERLGVLPHTEIVYAIKKYAGKTLPNDALVTSQPDFKSDILRFNPQILICFGARAFSALNRLTGYKIPPVEHECIDLGLVFVEGRQRRVVVVPNVRELQAFPEWRASVWQVLQGALTSSN